jgi:hypothetical protein
MEIRKPADRRYCKGLIFAPAGAGKTVLLGTAQADKRTNPMLLLDFEGGTESLAGLDIDTIPIHGWEDYNDAYEALANGDTLEFDGVEYDFSKYKSLGVDSVSETHKFALLEILRKEGPSRRNPDLVEQGDYGTATTQMRRLLREFRDLPMHVFFVAHAKETEIPREGRVRVPDLAGQMAEEIAGLTSMSGYLAQFDDEGTIRRTLLLHSERKFRIKARTRWGTTAPQEILDPTITRLLDGLGYGTDEALEALHQEVGSSTGKRITDEVPEDDPDRLPGKDPEEEDSTSDDAPEGAGNGATDIDLDSATLREMRVHAEATGIDLDGVRTRAQAREKILAAQE